MKTTITNIFLLCCCCMLAVHCIREISFEEDTSLSTELVVSGSFTDGLGPHILKLSRPGNYEKRAFKAVSGALVSLKDDLGNQFPYTEVPGIDTFKTYYKLENVKGQLGRTYTLLIDLPSGAHYKSVPEQMPESIPLKSVEMESDWLIGTTAEGLLTREPYAFVYSISELPQNNPADNCLRWDGDCVFIFNEIYTGAPFAIQHQCFITNRISDQQISLTDPKEFAGGSEIRQLVGKKKINYAFDLKASLNVYQRTISRSSYNYWYNTQQLISPTGTIFDTPPAKLRGNIRNTDNPDEIVLGLFEIAAVDTLHVFKNRGDIDAEFRDYIIPFCNNYSSYPKPECTDCLVFPSSTLQKPLWWQ